MVTLPRALNIYDEGVSGLKIKHIKDFVGANFGKLKVQIIKPKEKIVHTKGILFDFIATQKAFKGRGLKNICHVVLSDRVFVTLDDFKRPHIRTSIYSNPSVISIPGIVEGPAKPREFYQYKQRYAALRVWELKEDEVKKKFKNRFIDYGDKRLTEVIKGYIAQAIFFYMSEDPFCREKSCRLFNAHWQEDMIYAQITSGKFCKHHSGILEKIN